MVLFLLACFVVAAMIHDDLQYDRAYKNGQIDAITGNIQYELVEHKDMSKTWEKKLPQNRAIK